MQGSHRSFVLALAAIVALGSGCQNAKSSRGDPGTQAAPPAIPVKIEVARETTINDATEYVGTLKSRQSTVVNPEVEGKVTEIFVHSGDRVARGTPLMQIDPLKQEAVLHSQEYARAAVLANLRYAQQQQERMSQLYAEGVVSKQSLDEAQTALDSAKAQLASLDAQVREQQVELHYYRVLAPASGIVGDIPVHVGDRATTTTLLTTIDKPGDLEAYVDVPVERAPDLRLNQPVQILDGTGNVIAEGRVDFVSPEVNNQTQSILVKSWIRNEQGRLRTSQFVRTRIIWSSHPGIVIPVLAASQISGQFFAFVAEGEGKSLVARQRMLRLGPMIGSDYVVLDGIKPGDRIIVSGIQYLVDGAPIALAQ
jgi:RND family efflux transporter MFP subunit